MTSGRTYATRPLLPFSLVREWRAMEGATPIGPVRQFAWEAALDLPVEAEVQVLPGLTHYRCVDRWRIGPVDDMKMWRIVKGAPYDRV